MRIDVSKTVSQNLLALILQANPGLSMREDQITFGVAAELTGDATGKNSQVRVTAVANKGFSGFRDIKFNRLLVSEGVAALPTTISVNPADTPAQIRAKVAEALGLIEAEVEITGVPGENGQAFPENEDDTSVSVTVAPIANSTLYRGASISIQLTVPDTDVPLGTAIANDNMDGFDPVTA